MFAKSLSWVSQVYVTTNNSDAQTRELCVPLKAIEAVLTDQIPKRRRPLIQSNPSAELRGGKYI